MIPISPHSRWQTAFVLLVALGLTASGIARAQIGSPNNVTADPPVPRPSTTPCIVQLFFESKTTRGASGNPHMSRVSNRVLTADTLLFDPSGAVVGFQDRTSSQTYSSRDSDGACYSRTITAADGLLTSITDGTGCGNGNGH